jgi:hypothetical protein
VNNKIQIKTTIEIFLEYDFTNGDIVEELIKKGIDKDLVNDLYIFIPIIFFRLMLPNFNFRKNFIDVNNNDKKVRFDSLKIYNELELLVSTDYIGVINSEDLLKISSLSSEFKAINDVLLKTDGSIDDVNLTEMYIIR